MKHGGFYSGPDGFNPGHLIEHKFEDCAVIDQKSWGYRRNIRLEDIKDIHELIADVASIVSCNGNILINVGPTKEGTIIPVFEERLRELGGWLKVNGEAIYGTRPWIHQNDSLSTKPQVWYTSKQSIVYAIVLGWPTKGELILGDVRPSNLTKISLLGYDQILPYVIEEGGGKLKVAFPPMDEFVEKCGKYCRWGYVLEFNNLLHSNAQTDQFWDYVFVENV